MARIFPFGEGKTEKVIFEFLCRNWDFITEPFVSVGGKQKFAQKISNTLKSELDSGKEVRVIVFRDIDAGEKVENVTQSFSKIISSLVNIGIPPVKEVLKDMIYVWKIDNPPLRFVLHLAKKPSELTIALKSQTADSYVLALGLQNNILRQFANENKVRSGEKILRKLITKNIPTAIRSAKIAFDEDKDYLAAYLIASRFWVVKRTEDQVRLVKIILERAQRYDQDSIERVFKSWRQAIEEVRN